MREDSEGRLAEEVQEREKRVHVQPMGILTVDASGAAARQESGDITWHEMVNAYRTKKILSGGLSGIERLDGGWVVAVVYYKDYRVLIPMEEMMINLEGDGRENSNTLNRQTRLANNMLGAELDFIIREMEEKSRSVVASRKARDMSWEWMADANEKFSIGDVVSVMMKKISGDSIENLKVEVSAKEAKTNVNKENLMRLRRQGKYVGKITDVFKGTYFIQLDCRVNAVAHSCNTASLPGQGDEVGFLVTRINDEREVAEGIITRIIKRK